MLRIAPRGVVVDLVLDDEAKWVTELDWFGWVWRIRDVDWRSNGWIWRRGWGFAGVRNGGVVVELGAEDRVGILEIVEGILEKWEVRRC